MEHPRTVLVALAAAVLAAATLVSSAGAAPGAFNGDVCGLVTVGAAHAAGVDAACVQSNAQTAQPTLSRTYAANWGTSSNSAPHFMSVQVGPVRSTTVLRAGRLFPRGPGKLVGPVAVAPGVKAYYSQSAYGGVAGGRGTIRFIDRSHLLQVTILDASGNTLPGLEAVAKAIVSRM